MEAASAVGLAADLATGLLEAGRFVNIASDAWPGRDWTIAVVAPQEASESQ